MTRDSIQVTRCKDPLLWYADRIDHVFEVLEYDALRNVYLVATSCGRNIVYEEDCESWDVAQACAPVDDTVNHPGHYTSGNIEASALFTQAQEKVEGKLDVPHPLLNDYPYSCPVQRPSHYQLRPGYEVYDLRQDLSRQAQKHNVPHDQYSDWDRALEYLLRMWGKNKLEDARKARWYLKKLIEKIEETEQ